MEEEEEGEVKEGEDTSWAEVFSRLDRGDGDEDGRIACRDFIDWIDTLSFQDSISLEVDNCFFHNFLTSIFFRCARVYLEKNFG